MDLEKVKSLLHREEILSTGTHPTLFLDRDGTINTDLIGNYVKHSTELKLVPQASSALLKASQAGFKLAIITNQGGISKGHLSTEDLTLVHSALCQMIAKELHLPEFNFDDIQFSPFTVDDNSECRKPGTLMVKRAAIKIGSDLKKSYFIGDKDGDLLCGYRAGIKTILVRTGYGRITEKQIQEWPQEAQPKLIVDSLIDAVDWILNKGN